MTGFAPESLLATEPHSPCADNTQFCADDDFVLHGAVELCEMGAVSGHAHHEVSMRSFSIPVGGGLFEVKRSEIESLDVKIPLTICE
jgi:hypothetical protein